MAPLALLVFWLLPMSPPRFALPGIVDLLAEHDCSTAGRRATGRTAGTAPYVLDVVGSALLFAVAITGATAWQRWRRTGPALTWPTAVLRFG